MHFPSQEKALAIIQCLNILEKTGEMPTRKDGPLCLDAQKWSAQRLLFHLTEFFDIDEPEFYQDQNDQNEQNTLLAEETLREIIQRDENLGEIYSVLYEYSQDLPKVEQYQIVVPENKTYDPKKVNPDKIPNIWKWANCQLIFVSLDCCLKDPNGSKIKSLLKTLEEDQQTRPEGIIVYNYDKKIKSELCILDDIWYTLPEPYQLKGLGWIGRNHMCIEQCLDIMNKIRGQSPFAPIKDIEIN
jgi:hypothetical protein